MTKELNLNIIQKEMETKQVLISVSFFRRKVENYRLLKPKALKFICTSTFQLKAILSRVNPQVGLGGESWATADSA